MLTPTERLRRNLNRAYDDYQLELGHSAWRTANVRSVDGYLRTRYARLRGRDPALPHLLSQEAEFLAFQQSAPDGAEALTTYAMDAWRLCHQWQIPIDEQSLSITDNARTFLSWSRALRRMLRDCGAITQAELADHPALREPTAEREIYCHSFENTPTAVQNWLTDLASAGVRIHHSSVPDPRSRPTQLDVCRTQPLDFETHRLGRETLRLEFETPEAELNAVAQFARSLLLRAGTGAGETGGGASKTGGGADRTGGDVGKADPEELRIGIVIPDLAQRYSAVVRQFTAELDPLPAAERSNDAPFDIGAGMAVAEQPIWRVAADYLGLCYGTIATPAARRLLNSRYLALPEIGDWPDTLAESCTLADLVAASNNDSLRSLSANLPGSRIRPFGEWATVFEGVLLTAGWTGAAAGSHQYQAYQQIRGHLDACRSSTQPQSASDALETLQRLFATLTYAPERQPAPIQIMGYLETTGLDFTHLWVTGLDDQSWPRPARVNPFIPVAVQLQAQIPRVTADQELTFARQRLEHWRRSSEHFIVSHARFEGESQCMPSPLIAVIAESSLNDLQPARAHPFWESRSGMLESYIDDHGSPIELGHRRGGTGLIRDQAQCPFRGWAIHRLGLREVRAPHALPDALDRGIVIHEALHRLYLDAHQQPRNPETITADDIEPAVTAALNTSYRRFPELFRSRERVRLSSLLESWLQLDLARGSLVVVGLEVAQEVVLQGIRLNLRIDRIDRIEQRENNGSLVVVDYKSGVVSTRLTHSSDKARLIDPQLPIYACSNPHIRGVLYAQVNETKMRLSGVADPQLSLGPARLQTPLDGDWDKQLDRWREQLYGLVDEIKNGYAAVSPASSQICRNCHLQDFCRLSSLPAGPTKITLP